MRNRRANVVASRDFVEVGTATTVVRGQSYAVDDPFVQRNYAAFAWPSRALTEEDVA